MEELKKLLKEKEEQADKLLNEIIQLRTKILFESWKDTPECTHEFSAISKGQCPHGQTYKGQIYCNNLNCHK